MLKIDNIVQYRHTISLSLVSNLRCNFNFHLELFSFLNNRSWRTVWWTVSKAFWMSFESSLTLKKTTFFWDIYKYLLQTENTGVLLDALEMCVLCYFTKVRLQKKSMVCPVKGQTTKNSWISNAEKMNYRAIFFQLEWRTSMLMVNHTGDGRLGSSGSSSNMGITASAQRLPGSHCKCTKAPMMLTRTMLSALHRHSGRW